MTAIILLDELKKYIEEETKDLMLPVRVAKESGKPPVRPAEVHKMRLPDPKAEISRIPYVLLQFITGADDQSPGRPTECTCKVRIIAATYSEDGSEGAMNLLNLLTRIRIPLLKNGVVGNQFTLIPPLEMFIYPDSTPPFYLGEMMSIWTMPPIESEVNKIWQS